LGVLVHKKKGSGSKEALKSASSGGGGNVRSRRRRVFLKGLALQFFRREWDFLSEGAGRTSSLYAEGGHIKSRVLTL